MHSSQPQLWLNCAVFSRPCKDRPRQTLALATAAHTSVGATCFAALLILLAFFVPPWQLSPLTDPFEHNQYPSLPHETTGAFFVYTKKPGQSAGSSFVVVLEAFFVENWACTLFFFLQFAVFLYSLQKDSEFSKNYFQLFSLAPTLSIFRPFARRFAITFCPPFVRIRARKPCVRSRFRHRRFASIL